MSKTGQPRAPSPDLKTAGKRGNAETGTVPADIDTIPSCGSIPGKRGWGGARNSALRTSDYLTRRQCESLIKAAANAQHMGLSFNRHWTVHYERAGIAEIDATRFIGRLLKLTGDYARRHNGNIAVMWVRENGDGKGGHVHILLHLPSPLSLRGRTALWVRLAGGKVCARVSRIRSIGHGLRSADNGGEDYQQNVGNVLAYILKGADAEAGAALGLARYGEGGLIVGKRCGRSQNLGQASNLAMA